MTRQHLNDVFLSGFTSGATCAPTGSMARVLVSQRKRPRSWRTLYVTTANVVRREEAMRSYTASAGHLMTNHSMALYTFYDLVQTLDMLRPHFL